MVTTGNRAKVRHTVRALTLLEMVIVATILGIVTSVAVASYQSATSHFADNVSAAALVNLSATAQADGLDAGLTVPTLTDFTLALAATSPTQPIPSRLAVPPTSATSGASTTPGEVSISLGTATSTSGQSVPATGVAMITPSGSCVTAVVSPSHTTTVSLDPGTFTTCAGTTALSS